MISSYFVRINLFFIIIGIIIIGIKPILQRKITIETEIFSLNL